MTDTVTHEEKMWNGKKFTETASFHEYEIRLTQRLQNNSDVLRKKALKEVDKWLKIRMDSTDDPLKPESFILWKGLFYALWMADKPLVQEQIAQRISSFVNLSCPYKSMEFFKYGLNILCCEWFGIDQLRLDKFLMFVRRFLRNGLTIIKNAKYGVGTIRVFNEVLLETVLNEELIIKQNCVGLSLHFVEIFLEELAKVSEGHLRSDLVPEFLKPFVEFLSCSDDGRLISCVKKNIFRYLLEQSDAGQEHQAKFQAWSQLGYPGGDINAMQKVEVTLDEEDTSSEVANGERILDPRAGRVDVILPQIYFKPRQICKLLQEYRFIKGTNTKSRKALASLIELFEQMSRGNYPLAMKKLNIPKDDGYSTKLKNATNRLVKFEKELKPKKRKQTEVNFKPQTEPEEADEGPEEVDESVSKVKRRKLEWEVNKLKKPKKSVRSKAKVKRKPNAPDTNVDETVVSKRQPTKKEPDYEFSFERDSGTWYVYNLQNGNEPDDDKKATVFSENKWDPSSEEATKNDVDEKNTSTPRVIIQSVVVLRKPQTPQSTSPGAKKVKIDLKLNRSQEIHEHMKQVKSSPGIPFDATKRPSKPLLKRRFTTPIDPFYILHR